MEYISNQLETSVKTIYAQAGISSNSNITNSVKIQPKDDGLLLYTNDYIKFIISGRRKFARKIPISILIRLIKKSGFRAKPGQSINNMAFAIQTSIYKNGIRGKQGIEDRTIEISENIIISSIQKLFSIEVDGNNNISIK